MILKKNICTVDCVLQEEEGGDILLVGVVPRIKAAAGQDHL